MKIISWITDPHFNFISDKKMKLFISQQILGESKSFLEETFKRPDFLLVGGDIGEASNVIHYLKLLADTNIQIMFVTGNHSYYGSSYERVHNRIGKAASEVSNLIWLDKESVIELTPNVGLIGHSSWADCREGDWDGSNVDLNDYHYITDFASLCRSDIKKVMQKWADKAANHIQKNLIIAFNKYETVYMLTHVPPWKEASVYDGKISDDMWAPHFVCKIMGETIEKFMKTCNGKLIVLCGHSHGKSFFKPLPNIDVYTGEAKYGNPKINIVFEI